VKRVPLAGGAKHAEARLEAFVAHGLDAYDEARNEPESDGTSRLSPYLHFGHLSTHQVLDAIAARTGWTPERLGKSLGGAKAGWWKLPAAAEAFLDELVTWRELAFNMSSHRPDEYTRYDSLPAFARQTLETHARDARPHLYSLAQLERAQTHDPLWNAAQRQLVRNGWFHGYLRMLWGKKILEWSPTPKDALHRMDVLMSRYSLDGRDPVSWSGFMWELGRYDRAWGPERPIFGKVRYMSSENTARKVRVKDYVARYAP
jgi:deoxyribodipyrimidine photo-lyase